MNNQEGSVLPMQINKLTGTLLKECARVQVLTTLSDVSREITLELSLLDVNEVLITTSYILGTITPEVSFTLHLGKHPAELPIIVRARLLKEEDVLLDEKIVSVDVG